MGSIEPLTSIELDEDPNLLQQEGEPLSTLKFQPKFSIESTESFHSLVMSYQNDLYGSHMEELLLGLTNDQFQQCKKPIAELKDVSKGYFL